MLAIGDTHGCSTALDALLQVVAPTRDDLVVTLGDDVDRGPDSCGVIERLIALERHRLIPLIGDHDQMMLDARGGDPEKQWWLDVLSRRVWQADQQGRTQTGHLDEL